jgi:hypothetical protein
MCEQINPADFFRNVRVEHQYIDMLKRKPFRFKIINHLANLLVA